MMPTPTTLRCGLDLGGTKIQAVVLGPDNRVLGMHRRPTPTSDGPAAVVAALAESLRAAASEAHVDARALAGAGVGTPGAVDPRAGTVTSAKNLSGFDESVPLARLLAQEVGLDVALGNDVGVALDAEALIGAGRDFRSFVGVWWGTGIGGGVVIDGQRWLGRSAAGELGHMVVKIDGARCPCGRRGCVEAYAGRGAMELRARELAADGCRTKLFKIMEKKGLERLTSGVFAKALEQDDKLAKRLVNRAIEALGAGLASAVNLLDVEGVVIGGGLGTRLGAEYVAKIADAMQPHLFVPSRPPVVRVSELGDLAGAVGAAMLSAEGRARPRT
ncbi:MAG: ROK family protein [Planctomycetes bacterium]|nr:ROK family protein [Planctomycetota bacterium]